MARFLGTLQIIRCRILIRTQKGTIILTTTHIRVTAVFVLALAEIRAATGCRPRPELAAGGFFWALGLLGFIGSWV